MATSRSIYLLCKNSLLRVSAISISRRTFSVSHRQLKCASVLQNSVFRRPTLLSICKYSTEKLGLRNKSSSSINQDSRETSRLGLADELLAAKIQPDPKEKSKTTDDADKDKEERERVKRTTKWSFIAFGVMMTSMGGCLIYSCGTPITGPDGQPIPDEFSEMPVVQQYLLRTWKGMNDMNKMIQEPSREKLLPDPVQPPYLQPPYTLVLELRDILVHPEWTYETGWRFKKRPGVDFLLHHCAPPLFEIVIYTNEQGYTAFPLIDHLDPNGYIWYRLFRDSTRYTNGKHVKDLNCLNRDPEKVICVDWDADAVSNPRNHLKIKKWDGDMNDQSLLELGFMLRTIAESEVSDIREVIDYYRTFDDPLAAFRENQRLAQEHELAIKQKVEDEHQQKKFTSSIVSSFFRRN